MNIQPLTVEEAIEAIVTGDHPEPERGDLALDGGLIDALRAGEVEAARDTDTNKLLFRGLK